jgi:hypothetical protein
MHRSKPMKRSAFQPRSTPKREAKQMDYVPRPRAVAVAVAGPARMSVPLPKEMLIQHEGYMAAVRKLPCAGCGRTSGIQFCHADEGKGVGIKTDCRRGWPGCGPRLLDPGCHEYVGRRMTKPERRKFEDLAAFRTRASIRELGLWPKDLPAWPGDEKESNEATE